MAKIEVNAIGEQCPVPVVKATRALREMKDPGTLVVHVDNDIAVQNLMRMATGYHLTANAEKKDAKHFVVTVSVDSPVADQMKTATEDVSCTPDARGSYVVAISSHYMGHGDDELGAVLIKGFLYGLSKLPVLPKTILFYNSGAFLTTEGSDSLEDLRGMEAQGVQIITCGTCLNYYQLTEKLAVGEVGNMYTIVETMAGASKVIKP